MLSGIGTIGGAAAVLVAAILGSNAFATYRQQKLLERQIEHADSALTSAYKLNLALSTIRSPMSTVGDLTESERSLDQENLARMTDDRRRLMIQANVFFTRANKFTGDFDKAIQSLPFVKAYLGNAAFDALSSIIRAKQTVLVYANAYSDDRGNDTEFRKKIEEHIWEGFGDHGDEPGGDPIQGTVNEAIAILEKIALPILRLEVPPNGS